MSMYHLSLKTISRGDGKNALASAAYRSGEKLTDELTDTTFDYTRKQNIDGNFILAPEGAPEWTKDRSKLWNAVEKSETNKNGSLKKNARLSYEIELSLQQELSPEENMEMTKRFLEENFTSRGFVVDVNFHNLKDNENPHAHCMLTTRELTEDGFGKKIDRDTIKKREFLENTIRPSWEQHINETFEANNVSERVTCKSFKKLGITDKRPEKYLGPKVLGMSARGIDTDRMKEFREDKLYNFMANKEKEVKNRMEELKNKQVQQQASQNPSEKTKTTNQVQKPSEAQKPQIDPSKIARSDASLKDNIIAFSRRKGNLASEKQQLMRQIQSIEDQLKEEGILRNDVRTLEGKIKDLDKPLSTQEKAKRLFADTIMQARKRQKNELHEQLKKANEKLDKFLENKSSLEKKEASLRKKVHEIDNQSSAVRDEERKFKSGIHGKPSKSKSRNKGFQKD